MATGPRSGRFDGGNRGPPVEQPPRPAVGRSAEGSPSTPLGRHRRHPIRPQEAAMTRQWAGHARFRAFDSRPLRRPDRQQPPTFRRDRRGCRSVPGGRLQARTQRPCRPGAGRPGEGDGIAPVGGHEHTPAKASAERISSTSRTSSRVGPDGERPGEHRRARRSSRRTRPEPRARRGGPGEASGQHQGQVGVGGQGQVGAVLFGRAERDGQGRPRRPGGDVRPGQPGQLSVVGHCAAGSPGPSGPAPATAPSRSPHLPAAAPRGP